MMDPRWTPETQQLVAAVIDKLVGEAFNTLLASTMNDGDGDGDADIVDKVMSHVAAGVLTALADRGACLQ
jgi:hypothetical protein